MPKRIVGRRARACKVRVFQPGDYRFPYARNTDEMTTPEFAEKMKQGPVGIISIWPSGEINMGKLLAQWFVYSLFIAVFAAYIKSTRFTLTNSLDGIIYALITGATFGWLWPH